MKVKRYIATDVSEAMIKVKNELGRDAVILHTRKIKKPGIMGFLKKPLVEVIAAVDSSYSSNSNKVFKDNTLNSNTLFKNDSENIQNIHSQIDSIKSMLNTVLNKINNEDKSDTSNILNKYEKILLENNIAKPIVDKILTIVSRQISISDENEQSLKNAIKVIVKDYLGKPYSIENAADKPKVIFFVGPTGVGKTTTLAKLGAKLSVMNNKSVAFITSDTYRIAAVDQLKTYSEILSVPLTVIYEPHEIREAITKYNDKDYILVDTAGRNHKDKELLTELKSLISYTNSPEIFLLISLTTGYKDIISIVNSYDFLRDYKLIFTKLDEASLIGNILNVKVLTSKPLSYITTGQSVPDDIEIANIDKIVNCIVGEEYEGSSL